MLTTQTECIQIRLICCQIRMHLLLKELMNASRNLSLAWITLGLQKLISAKNKFLKNLVNKKDPILKEEFHTNYKKYRNSSSHRRCSLKKRCSQKFCKIHRNTPVPESLFKSTLLKKRLWFKCFPVKFLRTLYLQNTSRRLLLQKLTFHRYEEK